MEGDIFASYAAMADNSAKDTLIQPEPIPHEHIALPLKEGKKEKCKELNVPKTKEELYLALDELRKKYKPFLSDLAPTLKKETEVISLREFTLDGEKITIPHYGGPIGNSTKSYKTEFTLNDFSGKAVYFCCGGADYVATVYVNGRCAGIHEGFFSPFEYDITRFAKVGKNELEIVLDNDYAMRGNAESWLPGAKTYFGDKIYAATGIGYDEIDLGWHHCPPGIGLYHTVSVEIRNTTHITDVFVRPCIESSTAEIWIEAENTTYETLETEFSISVFGQNFSHTEFTDKHITPTFLNKAMPLLHGKHVYKIPVKIENPRLWTPDSPWLYQVQISLFADGKLSDTACRQFGMRSFTQDLSSSPKGMFYLNGETIKLRGANTMGFEQLDVMKGDYDQLTDDILLGKLCNMNFFRITQRPVQNEVYDYCDRLGMMTQTDFPLFGVMRRTKNCEAVRQVEEMAKLIRKHPCNVVISYMNEPWKNAYNHPHRYLLRDEMEDLFEIFDKTVLFNHPDCVIKHVDGDFDPPTRNSMPDVHCYTLWYNGGQQDFGMLHRGYGQAVAPDWYYSCGEYGAEGLDPVSLMKELYPKEWTEEPFDPGKIIAAQTKTWHGCFYETPDSIEEWVTASQEHQAFAMKYMTEAYRRDPRMISTALHLFIDAWPSGWLKCIMDCQRTPKAAYFASRDALSPLLVSIRSDRFTYYSGEKVSIETFICNDKNENSKNGTKLVYELYKNDEMLMHGEKQVSYGKCSVDYAANVEFSAPKTENRDIFTLKAFLTDANGETLAENSFDFTVFADVTLPENSPIVLITDLKEGVHEIAGEKVTVKQVPYGRMTYFLSRKTGHSAVKEFLPKDFRMWYDKTEDRLTPIAKTCFVADGFKPILTCNGTPNPCTVVGEKEYEGKKYVICLAELREENPVAKRLHKNLLEL